MIRTRLMEPRDLPDMLEMVTALAAFHGDTAAVTRAQLERDLCGPAPWLTTIVAEADGLVGYAALTKMAQLQFGMRGMDVHHLFVRAEMRGTGVGTLLTTACVDHARAHHCAFISVGTHPDNQDAARFYERRGFIRRSGSGPRFSRRLDSADQPPT